MWLSALLCISLLCIMYRDCKFQSAQGPKCLSSRFIQPAAAHVGGGKLSPTHISQISVDQRRWTHYPACLRSAELHPCVSIRAGLKGSEGHGSWRKINSVLNCTGTAHTHIYRPGFCSEWHFELISHATQFSRPYRGSVCKTNTSHTQTDQINIGEPVGQCLVCVSVVICIIFLD